MSGGDSQTCRADGCEGEIPEFDSPFGGTVGPVYCDECLERRKADQTRRQRHARRQELETRLRRAGVPERWLLRPTDAPEFLEAFAHGEFPRAANAYYLCGAKGAGKTYAACAALREWIVAQFVVDGRSGAEAMFASMPRLISESFTDRSRYFEAMDVEFLVLDDVGVEVANDYVDEKIISLLDAREKGAMPTVMTSNLRPQELPEQHPSYDARAMRRIVEMTGDGEQITGYLSEGELYR